MGSGKQYDLHEVFKDNSSQQMTNHRQMIQTFLDRGYEIEFQEKNEDKTNDGQLVAKHLVTILKPTGNYELPIIKLEAIEEYGRYFDDRDDFYPHNQPEFKLKAHQKSADIRNFNDRWTPLELN